MVFDDGREAPSITGKDASTGCTLLPQAMQWLGVVQSILMDAARVLYACLKPFHALMNVKERVLFWVGVLGVVNALCRRHGFLWGVLAALLFRQSLKAHWHRDNIQAYVKPPLKKRLLHVMDKYL